MKICIPIEKYEDLNSKLHTHFGSAPYFVIYDTEKDNLEAKANSELNHLHGACQPVEFLKKEEIKAVICLGMGPRALQKLKEQGIKVYRTDAKDIKEVIQKYKDCLLEELTIKDSCQHNSCH